MSATHEEERYGNSKPAIENDNTENVPGVYNLRVLSFISVNAGFTTCVLVFIF